MHTLKLKLLFFIALFAAATAHAQITGPDVVCIATSVTYTCPTGTGTWSSSDPTVAMVGTFTGTVMGAAPGSATITYTLSFSSGGGFYTKDITVAYPPTLTTSETPALCNNTALFTVAGADTYTWSPATGLSCTTCDTLTVTLSGAGIDYHITATDSNGCMSTAILSAAHDYIDGRILFAGTAPTAPSLKVWLIGFNPSDSSITATDSLMTCMDAGAPFFEFAYKPAGNYLLKAQLDGATPGTSGYVPTYSLSTPGWSTATSVTHVAGITDLQDITMIYGTVPTGPGFISGYVYSGAGKGTSGEIPVANMMVYLKNAAGQVLTYTYTDASGQYSFSSLAYGSYVIYPECYKYYTTPSATTVLSAATPSVTNTDFKQYTTSKLIKPYTKPTSVFTTAATGTSIYVYPNPASNYIVIQAEQHVATAAAVSITDMTGRPIFSNDITISNNGQAKVDLSTLSAGLYIIKVTSENFSYTGKLIRQD
jgi:hypothetical protein